jgi:hypothetical protein
MLACIYTKTGNERNRGYHTNPSSAAKDIVPHFSYAFMHMNLGEQYIYLYYKTLTGGSLGSWID